MSFIITVITDSCVSPFGHLVTHPEQPRTRKPRHVVQIPKRKGVNVKGGKSMHRNIAMGEELELTNTEVEDASSSLEFLSLGCITHTQIHFDVNAEI